MQPQQPYQQPPYQQQQPGYPPPQGFPTQGFPPQGTAPAGYQQQGFPQQQGPYGALRIRLTHPALAWTYAILTPQLLLDGQRVPARWGINEYPVPPGQHQVHVQIPYLFPVGKADATIPVQQGQPTEAEYAAPWMAFLRGALGPVPQKSPGLGVLLGIMGAVVLLIVLFGVIGAVAGSSG